MNNQYSGDGRASITQARLYGTRCSTLIPYITRNIIRTGQVHTHVYVYIHTYKNNKCSKEAMNLKQSREDKCDRLERGKEKKGRNAIGF